MKDEKTQKILEFPKGFFWGTATAAHQVEGGNVNNWSEWEKETAKRKADEAKKRQWSDYILHKHPNPFQEENYISDKACDHYNRFREDFDIAKSLGHNAYRFSIEWSRIEPEEGKFDEQEIEHYREVIKALREREIEPFVTLWHWTHPLWFGDKGGWLRKKNLKYFERYVAKMIQSYPTVKFWITLNEPEDIYSLQAYYTGTFPAKRKSFIKTWRVLENLAEAHIMAYKIIHQHNPSAMVGFANNMKYFRAKGFIGKIWCFLGDYFWNYWLLRKTYSFNDFIGCNYYGLKHFGIGQVGRELSDTGREIYPEGIYRILMGLKKYNKPIYITENGIADVRDEKRTKFIKHHLYWVHKAVQEGVNVRGYFHWSLLDTFEWNFGFWPRFGLVEVDYKTLERRVRPSARAYAEICKNNEVVIGNL